MFAMNSRAAALLVILRAIQQQIGTRAQDAIQIGQQSVDHFEFSS